MEKSKDKTHAAQMQQQSPGSPGSVLDELAREGARQMLAQAMEVEVAQFIEKHHDTLDG
jgi:hypothetical protein